MRATLRPILVGLIGVSIPLCYNACGKFQTVVPRSVTSSSLSEPLQFDRTSAPESAKGGFTIRGSCQDGLAIQIQIDGQAQASSPACSGGQFSYNVVFVGADGPKAIVATSIGADARERRDSVTVLKDTVAPAVTILNVVPMSGFVVISGACENALPLTFGGNILSATAPTCANGVFQFSANLTPGSGAKTLQVSQSDKAGNVGGASFVWTPDLTAPVLTVSSPVAAAFVAATTIVAGVCEAGLTVNITGSALAAPLQVSCAAGTYSMNLNVNGADGGKSLVASQTDASSNKTDVTVNVTKDTLAPAVSIINPAEGASVTISTVAVSGSCEAGIPVLVQGTGLAAPVQLACTASSFSGDVILSAGAGQKNIEVQQSDPAGNTTKALRTITSTVAAKLLAIAQPVSGAFSKGTITLTGACDTGGVLAFSGDIVAVADSTCAAGAFSRALTFSTAEGMKTVMVKQTLNTIVSNASRSFTKDSIAPVATIAQPLEGAVITGNFMVSGGCESGLAVSLSGSGLLAAVVVGCSNGTYSATLAATAGDGVKSFSVGQSDQAGNSVSVIRSVSKDTVVPKLSIAAPLNGALVGATLNLNGACETGIQVALSGSGLALETNANCVAGLFSTTVALSNGEGAKVITAKQTDIAGNTATVNLSVIKDSIAPTLSITDPATGTKAEAGLTIKGACENGLSVKASGTGLASEVSVACASMMYSVNVTLSAGDGVKVVLVSQTDGAGNSASVTRQFEKGSLVSGGALFAAAKTVLNSYCVSCHKAGGQASFADFSLATEAEFIAKGFILPGSPDQSKIIYRLLRYAGPTAGGARNMPTGGTTSSFPASAYDTLVNWVTAATQPVVVPTIPIGFSCVDPNLREPSLSYTLTKSQYVNSLSDLFGAALVATAADTLGTLKDDTFDEKNNARTSTLSTSSAEAYFGVAKTIAAGVVLDNAKMTAIFGSCSLLATPGTTCIDTYLNGFAKKIFRRPLSADEITYAKGIANRGGDYKANLKVVLSLHLQSPAFIWRLELGNASQPLTTQTELTPYEVATRISFLTADTTPDDTLLAAATAGQLATVGQVQAQVRRILATPSGRIKTKKNLMRWSLNEKALDFTTIPAALKTGLNTTGLGQAMVDETAAYIDYSVFGQNASFKTLLTSKTSLASNQSLALIYGHAPVTVGATASFAGRRQGLLMRAPFFSTPRTRTGIIRRGVDFQKRVLCNEIPPPDSSVVDQRDAGDFTPTEKLLYSNRDAIAHQTRSPVCMSCHATINPTGFAFENMDPFGRIRTDESIFDPTSGALVRTLPVNTTASVPLPTGATVPVTDAYDLVTYVATSAEGSACFARNAFRYVNERREGSGDNCELDRVHKLVSDSTKSVIDSLVELIANDALFIKKN